MRYASEGIPAIDAISVVRGSFTCTIEGGNDPLVEATLVYVNHDTGITFGTCPLKHPSMSAETRKLFSSFIESLEKDAMAMLQAGHNVAMGTHAQAESGKDMSQEET